VSGHLLLSGPKPSVPDNGFLRHHRLDTKTSNTPSYKGEIIITQNLKIRKPAAGHCSAAGITLILDLAPAAAGERTPVAPGYVVGHQPCAAPALATASD